MKILWMITLMGMGMASAAVNSVEDLRGRKRLLLVTESCGAVDVKLKNETTGLMERDVEVYVLNGPPEFGRVPGSKLSKELRERLDVRDGVAEVLLLGKDGKTTLRWEADEFSVSSLFSKIDAMPMGRQNR